MMTLNKLSPQRVALVALGLLAAIHAGGLLIFVKGFLLTRVALSNEASTGSLPPRYQRAVVLIVDALRFDFLFDTQNATEVYHNVFTLPARLAMSEPQNSFLAKFIADPPTTTLQRIKALTVGTLPTFVDAGSNFNGQAIEDDSWLLQANRAGKKIAFMGDDTWMSVFPADGFARPKTFDQAFPYDSFNVEDLDTVDHGVRRHLYPLLEDESEPHWDILIAHCLGLDHVGHRMGSRHPEMARKLKEANEIVERILPSLRPDDLLVVMGDHGMDAQGNHGGDSQEEVSAGLWMYSKSGLHTPAPDLLQVDDVFLHDGRPRRQVQQIAFPPTISLLLGLPIPFSNLGSVIPELFLSHKPKRSSWGSNTAETDFATLSRATDLNAQQILAFLETYNSDELAPHLPHLKALLEQAAASQDVQEHLRLSNQLMREVQGLCRSIWATFNMAKMVVGLVTLSCSLLATVRLVRLTSYDGCLFRQTPIRHIVQRGLVAYASGLLAGGPVGYFTETPLVQSLAGSAALVSSIAMLWPVRVKITTTATRTATRWSDALLSLLAVVHAGSYGSNSFVMWEDRITLYLVQIPLLLLSLKALAAPQTRLRARIGISGLVAMVCLRLIALSTVCREEQQPYCNATFHLPAPITSGYAQAGIAASFLCAWFLPSIATRFLDLADANQGIAPLYFSFGFRGCLLFGSTYWTVEWLIGALPSTDSLYLEFLTILKNGVAISLYTAVAGIVALIWVAVGGLNLGVRKEVLPPAGGEEPRTRIQLIGFANSLGSTYLVLFSAVFSLFFLLAQPVAQIALSLGYVVVLCCVEAFDSRNDVRQLVQQLEAPEAQVAVVRPPSFSEVAVLVLLGNLLFFATGHQAVLSTIQWKMAFVGSHSVVYPFSPIWVGLNTLGPHMLAAAAVPLLVFWNASPSIRGGPPLPLVRHLFRACLLFVLYHTMLTLPAALFAAWHRRHLMVWKIFAPRFMLSGVTLLAVDLAVIGIAFCGGMATLKKASGILGGLWS